MTRLNKIAFALICTIVAFTTMAYGAVHQPVIAFFYLLVTLLVFLWAAESLFTGELQLSRSRLQLPLILLGVYALLQAVPFGTFADSAGTEGIPRTISLQPFWSQVTAVHIFFLSLFFAAILRYLDSAGRLRKMAAFISIFGFLYAFYAILQAVLSPDKIFGIYKPATATPFGSFVNRHDFAAIIELCVAIPLGMLMTGAIERDQKLLYGVAIALMGSAMLLSGSRGGLVALIVEVLVLIMITTRAKGKKQVLLTASLSFLLLVAAICGAIFVGGDTSFTRFAAATASPDVSSNRMQLWAVTIQVIRDHFPLGAGLGAYGQAFTAYDPSGGALRVDQAHNDYLQMLADAGLVGTVLGVLFLFWFIRDGVRSISVRTTVRRGIAAGAFAGCTGVLVHSLFDFVLHITAISVMFLAVLGMLVAAGRSFTDEEEDPAPQPDNRRKASVSHIKGTFQS